MAHSSLTVSDEAPNRRGTVDSAGGGGRAYHTTSVGSDEATHLLVAGDLDVFQTDVYNHPAVSSAEKGDVVPTRPIDRQVRNGVVLSVERPTETGPSVTEWVKAFVVVCRVVRHRLVARRILVKVRDEREVRVERVAHVVEVIPVCNLVGAGLGAVPAGEQTLQSGRGRLGVVQQVGVGYLGGVDDVPRVREVERETSVRLQLAGREACTSGRARLTCRLVVPVRISDRSGVVAD